MDNDCDDDPMSTTADQIGTTHYYGVMLSANGSNWTPEDKINAISHYMIYGNTNKVAELTGIPQRTIYAWLKTEWWQELTTKISEENKAEFNAGFTRLVFRGINHIEQAFDNNEVSAMEAAKIMGISFDKRQILNNAPTSITQAVDNAQLQALKRQFEQLAGKTIEGERLESD